MRLSFKGYLPLLTLLALTLCGGSRLLLASQARSLPLDVLESRAISSNFSTETLEMTTPQGLVIRPTLRIPDLAPNSKLPVLVVFDGLSEQAQNLTRSEPANLSVIVAKLHYPFPILPTNAPPTASLKLVVQMKRSIRDALDAIETLHSMLLRRDDVDPTQITIVGAGYDAPLVLAAAANDPNITGIVLMQAFGDLPGMITHLLHQTWQPSYGFLAQPMAWAVSHLAWLYAQEPAPEQSVRRLTQNQHVLLLNSNQDQPYTISARQKLWRSLEQSDAPHDQLTFKRKMSNPITLISRWIKKKLR